MPADDDESDAVIDSGSDAEVTDDDSDDDILGIDV